MKTDFQQVAKVAQANAERVLAHFLPGGIHEGNEYVVLNPLRGDRHLESFKINMRTGIWKDFSIDEAGGDLIALVAYLQGVSQGKAADTLSNFLGLPQQLPKVVATFFYHDVEGNVVYKKERTEPGRNGKKKEFFFKHLEDGKHELGRGGESVLYNLPAVITSDCVFIVEGEKKADLLNSWGLCATTLDGGAGSVLTHGMIRQFAGKKVIFLPDNDVPGSEYVTRNANLLRGKVSSCKVVQLPGLHEKGDVLDWASYPNNDKNALLTLISESNNDKNSDIELPTSSVVSTTSKKKDKKKKGISPSQQMLDLFAPLPLFRDDMNTGWTFIDGKTVPISSQHVDDWLTLQYYNKTANVPSSEALNGAKRVLEAKARLSGETIALSSRVANHDNAIWYDLGNGRAAKITIGKFEVVSSPPLFKQWTHQQPHPEPLHGGDPWEFLRFCKLPDKSRLLILTTLITSFIPGIIHPILHIIGGQGAAKSFFCQLVKRVVDPSTAELQLMQPEKESDFLLTLYQNYLVAFDNLSGLKGRISDILCCAVTGTAITQRALYSNTDTVTLRIRNIILLNGRTHLISRADLLDRTITIHVDRIEPELRIEELVLLNEFDIALPGILGGIFATVANAMAIYPTVNLPTLPRLADFARWGYAVAEALGGYGKQFLADLKANEVSQQDDVITQSTLAIAIINYMENRDSWDTTVGEAWKTLYSLSKPTRDDKSFPSKPQDLRRALELLRVTLAGTGITHEYGTRGREGVPISFKRKHIPQQS